MQTGVYVWGLGIMQLSPRPRITSVLQYIYDLHHFSDTYVPGTHLGSSEQLCPTLSPPFPSLSAHLRDMVDRPHGSKGEHAEAPAGDEAHHHAATQEKDVAEQRAQHVGAGGNLGGKKITSVYAFRSSLRHTRYDTGRQVQ